VRRLPAPLGFAFALVIGAALSVRAADHLAWLGRPVHVAAGVDLFQTTDATLVESAGPIAVSVLRLDPSRVRLASALARAGEVGALDTVTHIAAARGAIAAVNGGLFNAGNNEPVGILKTNGELISDSAALEGVVAIQGPDRGRISLDFEQASVTESVAFAAGGRRRLISIDGIDTTRARGRLMLYTPQYHADTDTAPSGTEWRLDGSPLHVVEVRPRQGRTPIPRTGAVLSYGGTDLPSDLASLTVGTSVELRRTWTTRYGLSAAALERSTSVVGGAGLLRVHGRPPAEQPSAERLGGQIFMNARHPRTILGTDARGTIWIAAIDGRSSEHSVGMTFADLSRLCDRLGLTGALNLDGGSSTAMAVNGRLVNRPAEGEKLVNNAIVVTLR
jgi:hypothetical protein